MKSDQYQKETEATDAVDYSPAINRLNDEFTAKLVHYVLGVETEGAELADAVKKHVMYGKELDKVNLVEEVGDTLWYLARLLTLLDSSFEEAMSKNIMKLRARYGDKFTEWSAKNRNLEAERKILEQQDIAQFVKNISENK